MIVSLVDIDWCEFPFVYESCFVLFWEGVRVFLSVGLSCMCFFPMFMRSEGDKTIFEISFLCDVPRGFCNTWSIGMYGGQCILIYATRWILI